MAALSGGDAPTPPAGRLSDSFVRCSKGGTSMTSQMDEIRDQQRDTWDRFSGGWSKWDGLVLGWLAPFGDAVLAASDLRPDAHVLDIASGTGEPGLTAAARVPQGKVTLSDLSEGMLAVARANAARRGLRNIDTRVCDAGARPFGDASFDAVTCRFGYMFFPDIALAAREMARVARPGARAVTSVWAAPDRNPWATTIMGTIARHVELPPSPPGAPGLFRCAQPGLMRDAFVAAGLRDVVEQDVEIEMVHASPEQYWDFMTDFAAPVVAGLARADPSTRTAIRHTVLGLARDAARDGTVRLSSVATVIAGTR
ncbi:class I SAM-dependent methyltransferase [Falsiroseomonas sp. HW251]|uniref:class I SAM-dependent methyltransferase n=1 Tax=Falsiroseomonas sp. HW251 TaxID=3390998 RepID=UPI003D317AE4